MSVLGWFLMLFCGYGLVLGLLHKEKLQPPFRHYYFLIWSTGALLGLWLVLR